MRLVAFRHGDRDGYGVATAEGIVDAGGAFPGHADIRAILAAGALDDLRSWASGRAPDFGPGEVIFLPPIPKPDKIICVGLNYMTHIQESGRDVPRHPTLFARYANSQVAHGQPMVRPRVSRMFDFEGELAVVIGRTCRHVPAEAALRFIAGYACYNDGSVRDWQRHTSQFLPGKNFAGSGGFGPWITTADEIPDPAALTLVTRLNGEEMQRARTDDLVFDVAALIAYISTFTELVPGDVISTGTTGGVGMYRDPQRFLAGGDVVEVEISGIGTLRNPVVDEVPD